MAREDIRIKRVPSSLAYALANELEGLVQLDNIYFARSADPNAPKWQVFDRRDRFGDIDTDFKDVVLKFNPAGGLKFLAEHAMGYKPKFHFKDVELPVSLRPYELGYAPTALAVSSPERNWEVWGRKKGRPTVNVAVEEVLTDPGIVLDSEHDDEDRTAKPAAGEDKLLGYAWPAVIGKHIEHWATRADAREYANDDIVYTPRRWTSTSATPLRETTTRRWPAWSPSSAGTASRSTRRAWWNCWPRPRPWSLRAR